MNHIEFLKISGKRLKSEEDYVLFQKFQAKWVITDSLKKFDLKSKNVLDLGSGLGGYSQELLQLGANVFALDLNLTRQPDQQDNFFPVRGDCANIPFRSQSMDMVFCSSLIEHISDQEQLVHEISRVLNDQGICYLSFPPFFSPVGGHQFKPFHLLGEAFALKCSKYIYGLNVENYETSFGNWGLYPTTIRKVRDIVERNNFRILDITTRFSPLNFAKVPIFNEILTWHVEFILQKKD